MRTFPFLFTLFLFFSCSRDRLNETAKYKKDSSEYVRAAVDFIRSVKAKSLADKSFILTDRPFDLNGFGCMETVLSDAASFSKKEIAFIQEKKYAAVSAEPFLAFPRALASSR